MHRRFFQVFAALSGCRDPAPRSPGDTSRKMKKFLLKCEQLKSDKEVLEHAFELFGRAPEFGIGFKEGFGRDL